MKEGCYLIGESERFHCQTNERKILIHSFVELGRVFDASTRHLRPGRNLIVFRLWFASSLDGGCRDPHGEASFVGALDDHMDLMSRDLRGSRRYEIQSEGCGSGCLEEGVDRGIDSGHRAERCFVHSFALDKVG